MSHHQNQIDEVVKAVKAADVESIYLVGCGGSMAALAPMEYFFDTKCNIPVKVYSSNEFVYRKPTRLNKNSLVITRSHSGTTPETIEATKMATEAGALTVAISMEEESDLCKAAKYIIHYDYSKEKKIDLFERDTTVGLRLMASILNAIEPNEKYERLLDQLKGIEGLVEKNREAYKEKAEEFGKTLKRDKIIYTMASGQYYPEMYAWTSCLMMEMQWVHSHHIHSGEYFHGPFEITDYDVPFLIVRSNGKTKYLDDRAISFVKKYSDMVYIIDTNDFIYDGIDEELQEFVGGIIAGKIARDYAERLADHRGHPLSVRRYMWRMEY